ncbi:unnamed protein product [Didymodactylos carnosus]|uniref:MACPF domain-containing protein n=1 Tax=Didymodactylos carnosus TaxID=1234261 RepID=A0A815NUM7_9BILA|nr:unnamed protein product [Didymodactylos carnosus]CAF1437088.1 unnamed protein product [Didymodactylos carnosus]CAF3705614.1 unnamed protein product [Didymodactylos carnosus]CAF4314409.1 unnamed protein product [Didymodactylos carnosus]
MLNYQSVFFFCLIITSIITIHAFPNLNESDLFDLTSAQKALCPIVGFHGQFCPGINETLTPLQIRSKAANIGPLPLPTGVGITIDVSTGALKLPALEFTFNKGSRLWTDRESGQTFIVPSEILLTDTVSSSDNNNNSSIIIRIFRTETELADVWLRNAESGGWSGGQLADIKNISNLYDNYFKDNQATAISQDFKTIHTLTINNNLIKLNKYAQRAINILTLQYNESLYQRFLDAWGTHITVSTNVGGMTEQQILFKSCTIRSSEISNGLEESTFKENLKEELLQSNPCLDAFYYARRKKLIDHRIGGNTVLLNDTSEWKKTIVYDPALLSVIKHLPWYDFIPANWTTIKENLKRAIEIRMNATSSIQQMQAEQIHNERMNMKLRANVIVQTAGYDWTVGNDITLETYEKCSEGLSNTNILALCNTGAMMTACGLTLDMNTNEPVIDPTEVPVCYERNNKTSAFRVVARRQYGEKDKKVRTGIKNYDNIGSWSQIGECSILSNKCDNLEGTWNVYLCSGCDVQCPLDQQTQRPTFCRCSCPIYTPDPDMKSDRPYCKK